jgi:DNA-binding NarL/FixJ family response regulator
MTEFVLSDNQELSSFAIEHLLDAVADKRIYRAPDKTELVDRLKTNPASVVILDYTLFDFNDVETMLIMGERFPKSTWILLSEELTEVFLRSVIYGSHNMSILFKDSPLKEIREAILYAVKGERYICQRVTEILLMQRQREEEIPSKLTSTEIEIVKAIAQGKTTKEIAAERFSSIHTINTHRKNIFRKLGVNTAHEAVKVAVRSGLIDTSEYYI